MADQHYVHETCTRCDGMWRWGGNNMWRKVGGGDNGRVTVSTMELDRNWTELNIGGGGGDGNETMEGILEISNQFHCMQHVWALFGGDTGRWMWTIWSRAEERRTKNDIGKREGERGWSLLLLFCFCWIVGRQWPGLTFYRLLLCCAAEWEWVGCCLGRVVVWMDGSKHEPVVSLGGRRTQKRKCFRVAF